jgi:hypothetical protein
MDLKSLIALRDRAHGKLAGFRGSYSNTDPLVGQRGKRVRGQGDRGRDLREEWDRVGARNPLLFPFISSVFPAVSPPLILISESLLLTLPLISIKERGREGERAGGREGERARGREGERERGKECMREKQGKKEGGWESEGEKGEDRGREREGGKSL